MARGYSSVGRALPLQGRRQRFESAYLQPRMNCGILTVKKNQSIKGVWWRPRDLEPMKGVTTDEMPWGAGRMRRSEDSRMGQPKVFLLEFIEKRK